MACSVVTSLIADNPIMPAARGHHSGAGRRWWAGGKLQLRPRPTGFAWAAMAMLFLVALAGNLDDAPGPRRRPCCHRIPGHHRARLSRHRSPGRGHAALGVRPHLIQGWLMRTLDLFTEAAGPARRIDLGCTRGVLASRHRSIAGRTHLVEAWFADATAAWHTARLGEGRLHRLVGVLDARS